MGKIAKVYGILLYLIIDYSLINHILQTKVDLVVNSLITQPFNKNIFVKGKHFRFTTLQNFLIKKK